MMLVLGIICIILLAVSFIFGIIIKDNAKQLRDLKSDNQLLEKNIEYLYKYSEVISKIKKERKEVNDEILHAESVDDIIRILDGVINNNNSKL